MKKNQSIPVTTPLPSTVIRSHAPSERLAARVPSKPPVEGGDPRVNPQDIIAKARALRGISSLLNGLQTPYSLPDVRASIFKNVLSDVAGFAHDLGFAWVAGRNAGIGGDYIFVREGVIDGCKYHKITGPGFIPNMNGPDDGGYMNEKRTSIAFEDVHLVFDKTQFGKPTVSDERTVGIHRFEIDNSKGGGTIRTSLELEYFKTGTVDQATSKHWEKNWHYDFSSRQTLNLGGEMFPFFSFELNESGGKGGSNSGSSSETQSLQEGTRDRLSHAVETEPHYRAIYEAQASEQTVFIPYTAMATLQFSCVFHGFLRWGGGKKFQGDTNYHNEHSGSKVRPEFTFKLGGPGLDWKKDIRFSADNNASPWNWKALLENNKNFRGHVDWLTSESYAQNKLTFPVQGVIAGITRRNSRFVTVLDDPVVVP